jgi:hypothetical protein
MKLSKNNLSKTLMKVKKLQILKLFILALSVLLQVSCEKTAFNENVLDANLPSDLKYADLVDLREFKRIETSPPTYDSNGQPVFFELKSIRKGDDLLDETFKELVSIINIDTISVVRGELNLDIPNLTNAGKIIIEPNDQFSSGEYFFSIKASTIGNQNTETVIFDDALRIVIGPALVNSMSFCPFKYNFTSSTDITEIPAIFGGNTNVKFELGSDSDKLLIDENTGVISVNPSYTIGVREDVTPIINIISKISEEIVSFENTVTIALSSTPVTFDLEQNYFFYPTLTPTNSNITQAGGSGYNVEITDYIAPLPNWSKKGAYRTIRNGQTLLETIGNATVIDEINTTRAAAGVSTVGLETIYGWDGLDYPFETWLVLDEVSLTAYAGCYDSKLVFWVRQDVSNSVETLLNPDTPTPLEVNITNSYTGDVFTTNWNSVSDDITWTAPTINTTEYTGGLPYPIAGKSNDTPLNTNGVWIKCELDLTNYKEMSSFVVSFRNKTPYDSNISSGLGWGNFFKISDIHFVAKEKI